MNQLAELILQLRDYILRTIINNYSPTASVIISTHLIADVEQILDEVIFLQYGSVIRQGNVDDLRIETGESIDSLFRQDFKSRTCKGIVMFKKLLKYEFKSVGKWYLGIDLGVIILSVVLGFWIQALVLKSTTSAGEYCKRRNVPFRHFINGIGT